MASSQWRSQEFCWEFQQIQLRTGGRENGDLVALHTVSVSDQFAIRVGFINLSGCTDVSSIKLGIRLNFVNILEFRGVFEPPTPTLLVTLLIEVVSSVSHCTYFTLIY
jgi:hypothetical protein